MSREDRVRAILDALRSGDLDPLLAELDDSVVFRLPSLTFAARGRAAVTSEFQRTVGQVSSEVVDVVEHGPFVMIALDVESRLGGTVYRGPGVTVLRYEHDKIIEFVGFRADQPPS